MKTNALENCINNFINGNLIDARNQATKLNKLNLIRCLMDFYGYSRNMKNKTENHIRYAVTKINEGGYRVLACANRGQYHFLNKSEAETFLDNILKNNSQDTLKSVYGDVTKMRVDPIECYHHGDAVGIYIKE